MYISVYMCICVRMFLMMITARGDWIYKIILKCDDIQSFLKVVKAKFIGQKVV